MCLVKVNCLSVAVVCIVLLTYVDSLVEYDPCRVKSFDGICTVASQCKTLKDYFNDGRLQLLEVPNCGFTVKEEILCCPLEYQNFNAPSPSPLQYETTDNTRFFNSKEKDNRDFYGSVSHEKSDTDYKSQYNTYSNNIMALFNTSEDYLGAGVTHSNRHLNSYNEFDTKQQVFNYEVDHYENAADVLQNSDKMHLSKLSRLFDITKEFLNVKETSSQKANSISATSRGVPVDRPIIFPIDAYEPTVKTVGDTCRSTKFAGFCQKKSACDTYEAYMKRHSLTSDDIPSCGLGLTEEIICCPSEVFIQQRHHYDSTTENAPAKPTASSNRTVKKLFSPRPAISECEKFEKNLSPVLVPHILKGSVVKPGKYPHMAALFYRLPGKSEYTFRCGGTLIETKFVLTAAHCTQNVYGPVEMVRLGVASFDDTRQMKEAVEIPVARVHYPNEHPYSHLKHENDVAIIELKYAVNVTNFVRPTCLYTDVEDPPPYKQLTITGWGKYNIEGGTSQELMEAPIAIVNLTECQKAFKREAPYADLRLQSSHLCAYDTDLRDACFGDSGGPLNLEVDGDVNTYRVVGIISSGISCGTTTPGLFTRVAAYLNFIESVVWPNL